MNPALLPVNLPEGLSETTSSRDSHAVATLGNFESGLTRLRLYTYLYTIHKYMFRPINTYSVGTSDHVST